MTCCGRSFSVPSISEATAPPNADHAPVGSSRSGRRTPVRAPGAGSGADLPHEPDHQLRPRSARGRRRVAAPQVGARHRALLLGRVGVRAGDRGRGRGAERAVAAPPVRSPSGHRDGGDDRVGAGPLPPPLAALYQAEELLCPVPVAVPPHLACRWGGAPPRPRRPLGRGASGPPLLGPVPAVLPLPFLA